MGTHPTWIQQFAAGGEDGDDDGEDADADGTSSTCSLMKSSMCGNTSKMVNIKKMKKKEDE